MARISGPSAIPTLRRNDRMSDGKCGNESATVNSDVLSDVRGNEVKVLHARKTSDEAIIGNGFAVIQAWICEAGAIDRGREQAQSQRSFRSIGMAT